MKIKREILDEVRKGYRNSEDLLGENGLQDSPRELPLNVQWLPG
jgi:hypothetical protein